ncbi:ABC transporter ATP-binding protein [Actinotalea soli]|uniref:ABC transporter ATP-binding protein n=1 Tax=Actinotalea soli TaxID=2819234 RepID=UPI0027DC4D51|nr:ABC transporter ATP-binding protein [Actinotalea soli]
MTSLEVRGLSVDIGRRTIVDDVSFACAPGTVTGIVGPNGSGKSTVCRVVYRALRPAAGSVLVGGRDVHRDLSARQAAQRVSAMVQDGFLAVDARVHEAVMVGRTPHFGPLGRASHHDNDVVADALDRVGAGHLRTRLFTALSGGEKQRVLLARAMAQQADLLVLDEPTNHLDIAGQLELLDLVTHLPVTVVTVLHDLNLAAAACDHLLVMAGGRLVAQGAPAEVLTTDLLREVFEVHAHCGTNPLTGRAQLSFAPRSACPTSPSIALESP